MENVIDNIENFLDFNGSFALIFVDREDISSFNVEDIQTLLIPSVE